MTERHLTLVGLTEDKQRLVLVSDSGEEFTLPADTRLRAALRGEHTRPGQLEITMESALRPRDIQSRIRAGESPESVAAAAQTTLDKVMAYATPVLAERAHIADRAQRASVRRRSGEGPARVLADAVAERLRGRNVDPDSVEWDSWRREDGRWTLVADYLSGGSARHAEFVFDAPGRYVLAEDDEARWMVGEQTASKGPQPRATPGPRRLSAVDDEDILPLGEDAIEMVAEDGAARPGQPLEPSSEQAPGPSSGRSPEQPPEQQVRPTEQPLRPAGHAGDAGDAGDADWIATQATARPPAAEPVPDPVEEPVELGSEADEQPTDQEPKRPAKRSRRPSVPSWDEIMFGGSTREERAGEGESSSR